MFWGLLVKASGKLPLVLGENQNHSNFFSSIFPESH